MPTIIEFEEWRIANGYPSREQLNDAENDPLAAYEKWQGIWNMYEAYREDLESEY